MRIRLSSVVVNDQDKALEVYTTKLGFVKKQDLPMGEYRWLTVVSPEDPDGAEICLEPNAFPAADVFQKALFEAGVPQNAFASSDVAAEVERLRAAGAIIQQEPVEMAGTIVAVVDDECGNLIQLYQEAD